MSTALNSRAANWLIGTLAVVVPALVALLLYLPKGELGFSVALLPTLNAVINATVAALLTTGYVFIRRGHIAAHRACMLSALGLSVVFLLSYVTYHYAADETRFGGTGWIRPVYFTILISHIVLAAAVVPLALFTVLRALQERYDRHRRLARITFPIWLYVSVTGVIVYLMISPYYVH